MEEFRTERGRTLSVVESDGAVHLPFSLSEAHDNLVSERWRSGTKQTRLGPRALALYYGVKGLIPRGVQLAARRMLARRQSETAFPKWPFDDTMLRLLELYARASAHVRQASSLEFVWFWPDGFNAASALTHDVESAEGLRLAVELADLEEERGLRSSFNVVLRDYPIDRGIVRHLIDRGFEIGIHGVHHDRSMFASRETFDRHREVVREGSAEFGAEGFRSPATHRVFEWLADLPVSYDCTVPHSDPYEPIPGGCCSVWPFFIDDVVELPYTLPQDHTLFTVLGRDSIDVWLDQLDRLEGAHGMVEVLTHPDPGYLGDARKRALYAEFLDVLAARERVWHALPRDVAEWWRERDRGTGTRVRRGVVEVGSEAEDVAFKVAP